MSALLLAGGGRIGHRHLEAAAGVPAISRIIVVEPDTERRVALAVPPLRPATAAAIELLPHLDAVAPAPDLIAISAVTADRQLEVATGLSRLSPRAVLLEKPVAPSRPALDRLRDVYASSDWSPEVFVDCARRLHPGYRWLRRRLHDHAAPVAIEVSGRAWGYACNGVHALDLFRFLTGVPEIACTGARLDPLPEGSKRGPAFEEFSGTATFEAPGDHTLAIRCEPDGVPTPFTVTIRDSSSGGVLFTADETCNVLETPSGRSRPLGAAPASVTTRIFLARLLAGRDPALPPLDAAVTSHAALFDSLARATGRTTFHIT